VGNKAVKFGRRSEAGSDLKREDWLRWQAKIFFTLDGSDVIQPLH
jgi:hypothetical protein